MGGRDKKKNTKHFFISSTWYPHWSLKWSEVKCCDCFDTARCSWEMELRPAGAPPHWAAEPRSSASPSPRRGQNQASSSSSSASPGPVGELDLPICSQIIRHSPTPQKLTVRCCLFVFAPYRLQQKIWQGQSDVSEFQVGAAVILRLWMRKMGYVRLCSRLWEFSMCSDVVQGSAHPRRII